MATKRRGRGEGAIYEDKEKGRWVASISVTVDGKRSRKRAFGLTKAEAQQRLHEELLTGKPRSEGTKITLGSFLRQWADVDLHGRALAAGTIENHERAAEKITERIGTIRLADLTAFHVTSCLAAMAKDKESQWERQNARKTLVRALGRARAWGLIAANPCDEVEAIADPHVERARLTADQVLVLLAAAEREPVYPLLLLAVTTGLRQGELLGLKGEDLDLANSRLFVTRSIRGKTKTKKGRRPVRLPAVVVETLAPLDGHAGLLFADWYKLALGRKLDALLKAARLPDIPWRNLRHTHATMLLSAGIHPKTVQERLGHARINQTLDTYSEVLPDIQEEAADTMDRLLSSGSLREPVGSESTGTTRNRGSGRKPVRVRKSGR